jgi:hypothetical protein
VEDQDLAGVARPTGAMSVDGDPHAAGVPEHDAESVPPEREVLMTVQDRPLDEPAMPGSDLHVAGGSGVVDDKGGRRHPVLHPVARTATGRLARTATGRLA